MILDKLSSIVEKNKRIPKLYLNNLLKDAIQDYVLYFVYNHPQYKQLIFTGGTCLRKMYGLPRLSEDVDFDYETKFQIFDYSQAIKTYFQSQLQYKQLSVKLAKNKKTVFLKFPILRDLGLAKNISDQQILFVRCDFSAIDSKIYKKVVQSISTPEATFFVSCYDFPTLFANKIVAFLERDFFRGKTQTLPFKGRDIFDLVWLFEQSRKSGFTLQPNWERVLNRLQLNTKAEVIRILLDKIKKIDQVDVIKDLTPFLESTQAVKTFADNFVEAIKSSTDYFK